MSLVVMYIYTMNEVIVKKDGAIMVNEKELRMVELLSQGSGYQDIADAYSLSRRTIEIQVTKLRQKFGSATNSQLVATFLRQGLIK